MGNRITWAREPGAADLKMSNAASDVFWDALRLAAPSQPIRDDLLGWLLDRAPTDTCYGFSGFDLSEMPWQLARLEAQRAALLWAINRAATGYGWERLDYVPNRDMAVANLTAFGQLVAAYRPSESDVQAS